LQHGHGRWGNNALNENDFHFHYSHNMDSQGSFSADQSLAECLIVVSGLLPLQSQRHGYPRCRPCSQKKHAAPLA
jgi:hypothetical protein